MTRIQPTQGQLWPQPAGPAWSSLRPGATVSISYETGVGTASLRLVTINDVDDRFVWGHCHLRGAERCFRRDRIMAVIKPLSDWTGDELRGLAAEVRASFPALEV